MGFLFVAIQAENITFTHTYGGTILICMNHEPYASASSPSPYDLYAVCPENTMNTVASVASYRVDFTIRKKKIVTNHVEKL